MNKPCVNIPRAIRGTLASAVAFTAATAVASLNIEGDSHSHRFANGGKTVISFVENGSFTVTGAGTVELLAVGGGGGGGALGRVRDNQGILVGAGGGAGGLVHKAAFSVSSGTYTVTVGAGGAVGANGGNTVVAGNGTTITAYGGGYGGAGGLDVSGNEVGNRGGNGASGGGSSMEWLTAVDGGLAIYGGSGNAGHDGSKSQSRFSPGGGGGAGASPAKKAKRNEPGTVLDIDDSSQDGPAYGGDGLACDITGVPTYYAGGGAAYMSYNTDIALGGKGGGGNGNQAGTDGLGGGGGAGQAGGSGVVILSFTPDVETTDDFALSGGDAVAVKSGGIVHTFTQSGTLSVSGSGTVELLAVGGGGGGGAINEKRAAGGGAGGLVHMAAVPVSAGSYSITIGAGGAVGANGGDTSALGVIAHGGGAGTRGDTTAQGAAGGSGGGAAVAYADRGSLVPGGLAAYGASMPPFSGNLGHAGAGAMQFWGCGGGGGAGSSPTKRNCNGVDYAFNLDTNVKPEGYPNESGWVGWPSWGGDGLAIDISGESVYYAGGGAAARVDGDNNAQGGLGGGGGYMNRVGSAGTDGLGGGGAGGFRGGSGVVIIRYLPAHSKAFEARGGATSMDGDCRVHKFTTSGTFTMPCNGLVDILLVGGGGGGGALGRVRDNQGILVGAGGGAGGLVHKAAFSVSSGTYTVTVGAGGAVGANGGNTVVAGNGTTITAYGGGYGGAGGLDVSGNEVGNRGGNGASGGGSSMEWLTAVDGGLAIYGGSGNAGHDGSKSQSRFSPGGGGGAGASPAKKAKRNEPGTVLDIDDSSQDGPAYGGDGLACDITGVPTYYAGGGAAYMSYNTDIALGGKGGGGNGNQAGTDGLGGGGGAGQAGGSGVVIIRYRFAPSCTVLSIR